MLFYSTRGSHWGSSRSIKVRMDSNQTRRRVRAARRQTFPHRSTECEPVVSPPAALNRISERSAGMTWPLRFTPLGQKAQKMSGNLRWLFSLSALISLCSLRLSSGLATRGQQRNNSSDPIRRSLLSPDGRRLYFNPSCHRSARLNRFLSRPRSVK